MNGSQRKSIGYQPAWSLCSPSCLPQAGAHVAVSMCGLRWHRDGEAGNVVGEEVGDVGDADSALPVLGRWTQSIPTKKDGGASMRHRGCQ